MIMNRRFRPGAIPIRRARVVRNPTCDSLLAWESRYRPVNVLIGSPQGAVSSPSLPEHAGDEAGHGTGVFGVFAGNGQPCPNAAETSAKPAQINSENLMERFTFAFPQTTVTL